MHGDNASSKGEGDNVGTISDGGIDSYEDVRVIVADGLASLVDGKTSSGSHAGGETDGEAEEGGVGAGDADSSGGSVGPITFGVEGAEDVKTVGGIALGGITLARHPLHCRPL